MRAVVCPEWGGADVLKLVDLPAPECGPNQIIIAVRAWGVNFADLVMIGGQYHLKPPFPFVPGMEVAGEVIEVGANVKTFTIGNRVAAVIGGGGYAEFVAVEAKGVFLIPDNMGWPEAGSFLMCYSTAYVGLVHRGQLRSGENLVVMGAGGGVGLAAVAIGKRLGANVIAVASTSEKLSLAQRFGASGFVNYTHEDVRDRVKDLTRGRGADVVYDPVGGDAFDAALRCIAFEGRIVVIGFASGQIRQASAGTVLVKACAVIGSNLAATQQHRSDVVNEMNAALSSWHAEKALPSLVTKELPFTEVARALSLLANRSSSGRIVLRS